MDLRGQVVLVTGAAGGIGRAVCLALAREGARVACLDLSPVSDLTGLIEKRGGQALALEADLSDRSQAFEAVESAVRTWGRLEALIACAGVLGRFDLPFAELEPKELDGVLDVNLKGVFYVLQAVWPRLKQQNRGKVVLLGSIAGRAGGVLAGPHYCASKGAVHALVKWAAKRGAPHNINVNAIAPGPIETPMIQGRGYTAQGIPLGRLGRPEDVAEPALFLVSQASNYITGQILDVNGGLVMT